MSLSRPAYAFSSFALVTLAACGSGPTDGPEDARREAHRVGGVLGDAGLTTVHDAVGTEPSSRSRPRSATGEPKRPADDDSAVDDADDRSRPGPDERHLHARAGGRRAAGDRTRSSRPSRRARASCAASCSTTRRRSRSRTSSASRAARVPSGTKGQWVTRRGLRRHDVPSRHQGLHGAGRRSAGHRARRARLRLQGRAVDGQRQQARSPGSALHGEPRPGHERHAVLHHRRVGRRTSIARTRSSASARRSASCTRSRTSPTESGDRPSTDVTIDKVEISRGGVVAAAPAASNGAKDSSKDGAKDGGAPAAPPSIKP